jgi:polyphosphate kinase 2 (PPK2 family)
LQRQVKALGIPVVVVFESWSAAGKGTLINELILPLDPRGFTVHSASGPTEEEAFYPFLWRFWKRTPTRGRLAIFDRSWNRRVVTDRVDGQVKGKRLRQAFEDIRSFERQLADEGVVIVKCFLHISKKGQKRRFDILRASAATAWRVTEDDRRQHKGDFSGSALLRRFSAAARAVSGAVWREDLHLCIDAQPLSFAGGTGVWAEPLCCDALA